MRLNCRIPLAQFDVDLDVEFDARVTAVFGPSGAGKTSLLDAIAGLRPMSHGEIDIGGKTLFSTSKKINLPPRRRAIGYVPQEAALFPHLTVRQNMLFGGRDKAAGMHNFNAEHVAEVLEIAHLLPRAVSGLSGGEAQRVALARAILSQPQLLLLDEPLAALDIGLKEKILPYLKRVRDEFAIPMIYVTHNLTEVLALADWVLMIQQGKLIAQGVPKDTLHSPKALHEMAGEPIDNLITATLIESNPAGGTDRVRTALGTELLIPRFGQTAKGAMQIRVGADDILLATEEPRAISAGNVLPGVVRRVALIDGEALVTVQAGEEFLVRVTAAAVARLGVKEQSQVYLIVKARSFRLA